MNKNMYLKNGLFLCLTCLVLQNCTTYSVLPKNISPGYAIEGVYSNYELYDTQPLWSWYIFGWKDHSEYVEGLTMKVEIVNPKLLECSFYRNGEYFRMEQLKGKFKKNGCFYTRRSFGVIPLFPLLFLYGDWRTRVHRVDDELIMEKKQNGFAVSIFTMPPVKPEKDNDIIRFKQR